MKNLTNFCVSSVVPQVLFGIAFWLLIYGAVQVQPKIGEVLFKQKELKEFLQSYDGIDFSRDIVTFGAAKALMILIVLPIVFNILTYLILGIKLTIGIQAAIYVITRFI